MTYQLPAQQCALAACLLAMLYVGHASAQSAKTPVTKPAVGQAAPAPLPAPVPVETAALRISCEGDNAKAEVSINGVFKGECPLDVSVTAGLVTIRAAKYQNKIYETFYEEQFRLGADVGKRVDLVLKGRRFRSDAVARMDADVEALLSRKEDLQRAELPALERAAEGGDAAAMRRLGTIYKFGLAGAVDQKRSAVWFARGAQAKDPASMYELAMLSWKGLGVPVNEPLAAELLRASAEAGNPLAMYWVGSMMDLGRLGFQKNLKLMADYGEKAARAGVEWADYLWSGAEEVLKTMDTGARYKKREQLDEIIRNTNLKVAEGQEDFYALRYAAIHLFTGQEPELSLKYSRMVMRYKKKAAATGEASSLTALGFEYEIGVLTPKDLATAERLYRQAIALGDKDAAARLANISK